MSIAGVKCLVTGGAGFIGSHVAERLLSRGASVRVVDNLSTGDPANLAVLGSGAEVIIGDLVDPAVSARAVEGIDTVFHLAALPSVPRSLADPWGSHDANVNSTVRLLDAARAAGVRRIVYSSSSSVYGDTQVLPKVEQMETLPRSPYAASKLAGEQYVLAYARSRLVEGVALRYFNVFGPRQSPDSPYAAVIPLFFRAALSDEVATLFGDGEQTRDFTYIDNVVDANLRAAFAPAAQASGLAVNVGAGSQTTLNALLDMMREVTGRPIRVRHQHARPGDVRDSLAGLERARQAIGYEPTVSVTEGLARTWEWTLRRPAVRAPFLAATPWTAAVPAAASARS